MLKRADSYVDKIPHRDFSGLRSRPEEGGFYMTAFQYNHSFGFQKPMKVKVVK